MQTVHLMIKGNVQGVFYRASAKEVAEKLSITGWIKNTINGEVEAMASGDTKAVQEFINWCKKGPSKAIVKEVVVTEKEGVSFNEFSIIR